MNKFNHKIVTLFIIILVIFQNQTLWAISTTIENEKDFFQAPKLTKNKISKQLQETFQNIKDDQYPSQISLNHIKNTSLEELRQIESIIMPNDDLFDNYITLILMVCPKKFNFDRCAKFAEEKGTSEGATSKAQVNLGLMYYLGKGVEINLEKAIKYLKKAAKQGHIAAQNDLGVIYHFGNGIDVDFVKAFKWYQKAADQGHASAQNNIGFMYEHGQVVNKNLAEAFKWYQKAADQGEASTQRKLGNMYKDGQGVDRDLGHSLKWYLESSKNRNTSLKFKIILKESVKSFITFVPSSTTTEEKENFTTNQEILRDNIEVLLGLHDLESGINNSASPFKESKLAISEFFELYQKIVNFEEILLQALDAFHKPGFMVTCLQPQERHIFKLSRCLDIKCYEFQDRFFLSFGQDNIKKADQLMDILNKTHPCYETVSNILDTLVEIQKNYHTENAMKDSAIKIRNQYLSRLILKSENQFSDETKTLTNYKSLTEKVEQEIELLQQLQNIPQQLEELLIEGIPLRNNSFLHNNNHIKSIFED